VTVIIFSSVGFSMIDPLHSEKTIKGQTVGATVLLGVQSYSSIADHRQNPSCVQNGNTITSPYIAL
jgi:hypothetical protein